MSQKLPVILITCPSCGKVFPGNRSQLRRGRGKHCSKSCSAKATQTKHGHSSHSAQSATYGSWSNMVRRCRYQKNPSYKRYGAAGIDVCEGWLSFGQFLADMGERPKGTTLDRINGSLGYSKENCRWATPIEQANNLKNNVLVPYQGRVVPLSMLSRELGVKRATLKYRIDNWPESEWTRQSRR